MKKFFMCALLLLSSLTFVCVAKSYYCTDVSVAIQTGLTGFNTKYVFNNTSGENLKNVSGTFDVRNDSNNSLVYNNAFTLPSWSVGEETSVSCRFCGIQLNQYYIVNVRFSAENDEGQRKQYCGMARVRAMLVK
jgi:hypothetical protein